MNAEYMQQFCIVGDFRSEKLGKPWSAGEWTYASNGHIMVRVKRLSDVPENPEAPNAEAIFAKASDSVKWLPVRKVEIPPDIECDECNGTGKIRVDCGNVQVGHAHFQARYLAMIQGWEIAPDKFDSPAWIRNGSMDGLLMPIKP